MDWFQTNKVLSDFERTIIRLRYIGQSDGLAMAGAASMPTARTIGMPAGASVTAVVVPVSFDSLASVNHTQARVTGAFHLGHSRHSSLLGR